MARLPVFYGTNSLFVSFCMFSVRILSACALDENMSIFMRFVPMSHHAHDGSKRETLEIRTKGPPIRIADSRIENEASFNSVSSLLSYAFCNTGGYDSA